MTTNVLHATEHYDVLIHTNPTFNELEDTTPANSFFPFRYGDSNFDTGYIVRNRATGVVEATTTVFPEAIYEAERLTDAIELAAWRWFKTRRDLISEGKIKDENEYQLDVLVAQTEKMRVSGAAKKSIAAEMS